MRVLVTGGAGFIGSNFARYIKRKYPEYKVCVLDKLTYAGNRENLAGTEVEFVHADISSETAKQWVQKCDMVVNFAAETHVDRSIGKPEDFIKTDVLGTHNLLEAARVNNTKYIQISTDEVYGSIETGSFSESDPLEPSSPYSASKAGADMLAISYHKTYNLPVIITRSSNNFGPYQYPEKVIPLFITNLLEGKKVPLYGDGKNVRDWIYVEDNCRAIDIVMHKGEVGTVYNIGAGCEKTNIEITKSILHELGLDESYIEYVKDRAGHDRRYSLDISKIKSLGFEVKFDFKSAIKRTVEWYKNNREWWVKIKSGEFKKYYQELYNKRHEMKV